MTTPAGPVTLTPGQFARTSAAAKPGATYAKYQKFIAARRSGGPGAGAPPGQPQDPYNAIIGSLPQPSTTGQMQSQAQGEISPIVAAIVNAISKNTKGATGAISGYANDAAKKLTEINYGAPYQQGEGAQAAVDAALAQEATGQGTSDAQSLQQRLAVINDPSVAAAAANVQGNAAGNATAGTAQGSAALSSLIANAAAAKDYGNKLPGIQRAQGLQDIAGVQQTGQQQIASGTTAAEQQLPSILSSLRGENDNRASAIASARQNQLSRNDALAAGGQKESDFQATLNERAQATNATNNTRVDIAKINANQRASTAQMAQARSDRSYRLQLAKTLGYDPVSGNLLPGFAQQGGRVVKVGTGSTTTKGGLTQNEILKNVQSWHDGKPTSIRTPTLDPSSASTTPGPGLIAGGDGKYYKQAVNSSGVAQWHTATEATGSTTYQQALKKLTAAGVPQDKALAALDGSWKRGEGGRSWLTNGEQASLSSSGLPPKARVINGHGVLTSQQAAALKKAGKLPAGQATAEGYYVIDQVY